MSMLRLGVLVQRGATAVRHRGDEGRIASEAVWLTVLLAASAVGFGALVLLVAGKAGQVLDRVVNPG